MLGKFYDYYLNSPSMLQNFDFNYLHLYTQDNQKEHPGYIYPKMQIFPMLLKLVMGYRFNL